MSSGQNNLFQVFGFFFFIINIFVTVLLQHLGFKDNFKGILKETSNRQSRWEAIAFGSKIPFLAKFPCLQNVHFCKISIFATSYEFKQRPLQEPQQRPTLAPSALFFVHGELLLLDSL